MVTVARSWVCLGAGGPRVCTPTTPPLTVGRRPRGGGGGVGAGSGRGFCPRGGDAISKDGQGTALLHVSFHQFTSNTLFHGASVLLNCSTSSDILLSFAPWASCPVIRRVPSDAFSTKCLKGWPTCITRYRTAAPAHGCTGTSSPQTSFSIRVGRSSSRTSAV